MNETKRNKNLEKKTLWIGKTWFNKLTENTFCELTHTFTIKISLSLCHNNKAMVLCVVMGEPV